ncbi:MAG: homoserine kinase [Chloroflexota bacterium]
MTSINHHVAVEVPATSANLGPGFDCLGIALNLYNTVKMTVTGELQPERPNDGPTLTIQVSGVDANKIPRDTSNLVYQTATLVFERAGLWPAQLTIEQEGQVPVGSGLGSSSAAVVAGLFAANTLTGNTLTRHELLRMAAAIEGHPDNVAPAILGGLVLGVMSGVEDGDQTLALECLRTPLLKAVVALPEFHFPTLEARSVLPDTVARRDAIHNAGRVALLVHALTTGNYGCLRTAMDDKLHQPYRLPLIPGATEAMAAAYEAGAAGVALSGAGPSLIAFAPENHTAIAGAMAAAFADAGLPSRTWSLEVEPQGAHLL